MAAYSIATTALALDIERKRLENILSRHDIPGTRQGRQGQARRLTREAVVNLAAIVQLENVLSIPAPVAAELVRKGRELPRDVAGAVQLARGAVALLIDFAAIERALLAQLSAALEMAPRPRRGRPRREATRSAQLESK